MLEKLTHEEKKALIAIARYIVSADGIITSAELDSMNMIAEELGFDDYHDIFNEVDAEITSMEDLKKLIEDLADSKHKKTIIKLAIEISRADANIRDEEKDILVFVADAWDIDINSMMR
ncbi:MAG TPA: TerB family tellurite resistance protein [Spirochaetota bacterium]|jgi:tellurite resistance protein|nr:TerB family tellurite resistance protein [Spirochaetota bacterium]OQA96576.1 MAG: Tellurite resistance protein TerB [Spirochaetes bacterium ADurb.Bin218]HOK02515.1 TerB family tellurite resistance protein [Spirochaetota bacterium]HOK92945.1 TerB family tellurite resistance protein [Spirochaetota bacterium]HON16108.1 TerB family tellurite resistance protein [Spirochaetota bacterium]